MASNWSAKSQPKEKSRFTRAANEPKADPRVAIYNLATGEAVQSLRYPFAPYSIAISHDNRWLAAAQQGSITVRDLGRPILKFGDLPVLSVALSQDGGRLAAVVQKRGGLECILWDVLAGKQIAAFKTNAPSQLRFLHQDRWLAFLFIGSDFTSGRIVNSEDGTEIVPTRGGFAMSDGHLPRLIWGATSLDSHFTTENYSKPLPGILFTESLDGVDPIPLEIPTLSEPENRERVINAVTLSGNGAWLAIGLRERPVDSMTYRMNLILRNLNDSSDRILEGGTVTGFVGRVLGAAVSHDGRWAAATFHDGDMKSAKVILRIWDVDSGRPTDVSTSAQSLSKVLGFIGPWETFLVETQDRRLEIWSAARGERIAEFAPPDIPADVRPGLVQHAVMAVSADGASLAVSSDGGRILLVDPVVGALRAELPLGSEIPNSLAFSGDGRTLAAGMSDGTVRLWFAHRDTALSSP